MINEITKSFQANLQTSTKIFKSSEFVSDLDNFFVNRVILYKSLWQHCCWTQTSWQVMQQDSDWLVVAASHASLSCVKRSTSESVTMGVRKEEKRAFAPLEIWSKNQKRLENLKTAVKFRLISLILAIAVYLPAWHTAQEIGSLFWCHEVVSLQFTHVRYFACRCRLQSLWADCSIVTLYCVTMTWQQIFKGSVTVVGVVPHVTVESRHLWQKILRESDC